MTRYSDTVESIDFTVLSRLTRYSVKFFYIYCSIVLLLLLKKRKYIVVYAGTVSSVSEMPESIENSIFLSVTVMCFKRDKKGKV